jgi:hypothetical protein
MSRTPAKFTQADVNRATRAAVQAGATAVRLLPDGTIRIDLQAEVIGEEVKNPLDADEEIVL